MILQFVGYSSHTLAQIHNFYIKPYLTIITYTVYILNIATIQRAQFRGNIYGNAQVTRKHIEIIDYVMNIAFTNQHYIVISHWTCVSDYGRTDVVNTISEFVFKPVSTSAFGTFTINDDDVLEFDELFIAGFSFDPNTWYGRKGEPSTAFILIRDDDCELYTDSIIIHVKTQGFTYVYTLPSSNFLSVLS